MTDLHTPHKLAEAIAIEGRKGGSAKPHTPTEQPDSAASVDLVKMLFALGEGEWEGGITDRDIYLNDTPLGNADGTRNFQNVQWEFRAGSVDQTHIAGIPAVDNETSVGVELKGDAPYVYSASNRELSALRVRLQWPSIYKFLDNGDQVGYRIEYAVDLATGSGPYQQVHSGVLDDKVTSTYSRTVRVDLPPYQDGGWRLRVRRLTPNANSNKIADTMRIAAVSEVIDAKLRYPNTALLFVQFDASTFQGTPQVSVMAKGRKVRVPSNYDPESRTYSGTWDGSFVSRYTTNPTWHWYDIVLNRRFGLGRRIDATMVNKWALYRISQYCDQAVPDGLGGTEPRFTCNVYLQNQAEAWTVLRDISAIFRGMTYWSGSEMVVDADMPSDVVYTFSPSNIEGDFDYVASPWRDRYSITAVKWDNPGNNFKTETKPVPNLRAQARYGVRQADISAIGCTSVSEAGRRGEWVNTTSYLETNTVTFQTGVEGRGIAPGKLIAVADPDLAGKPMGGRLASVQSRSAVTLDRDPVDLKAGDILRLNMPSGVAQIRTVSSVAGRAVTVSAAFGETPVAEAQWSVERQDLKTQTFRVLSVVDGDPPLRKITAIQHNTSKFDAIDRGARIEVPPVTSIPAGSLAAPAEVRVAQNVFTAQGLAVTTMSVSWDRVEGAIKYEVQWRRDNGSWVAAGVVSTAGLDVQTVYAGVYVARVRAISSMDIYSIWTESEATGLQGKTDPPPVLASLTADSAVFSIVLRWTFPPGMSDDVAYTELQYGVSQDEQAATSLGLFSYPTDTHTLMGLASGQAFNFRGRLRDRSGNVGAWSPWVRGTASASADEILDYLGGQITEKELGKDLLAPIQSITASATTPGSVAARIKEARDALQQGIDAVQQQVDNIGDLADAQEYKPTEAYKAGAIVTLDNALYQAKADVAAASDGSNAPPKTALWRDAGAIIRDGDGLAARVTSQGSTITQQGNSITANSNDITQLKTSVAGKADSTALQALQSTVTSQGNTITSQGSSITSLTAGLKGAVQQAFNIVPNPTFDPTYNTMGFYIVQTTAAGVPANCPFPYAARITARDNYASIDSLPNVPVKPGDVWRFSALVAAGAGTGTRPFQHYATRATTPSGGRTAYQSSPPTAVTQTWTRVNWDHTIPAGQTFLNPMLQIETLNAETATWYVTDWHCENITAAKAAQATADAAASAVTSLGSRVTQTESAITAQASSITKLQSDLSGLAGAGSFTAAVNFEFLSSLRGAYLEQAASNATITAYQQNLTFTGYANLRLPVFAAVNGAQNYLVKMRVRLKNASRNPARLYWANEDGGLSEARTATFPVDLNNPGWQDITVDLGANLAWATKVGNNSMRFDFLNSQDTNATVDVAYIAFGRPGPSASATALNETQTQVTQIGSTVTALTTATQSLTAQLTMDLTGDADWNIGDDSVYAGQVTVQSVAADQTQAVSRRTDSFEVRIGQNAAAILDEVSARTTALSALASRTSTLEASVGDGLDTLRAQVDTTSKAVAGLDGKVSASQVTRVQVTANGISYAAGFAIGVDYSGGVTSSQFLVQADTFGVLNGTGNAQTSLVFSIVGGVSYLRQAMIQQATIQNLIVGANLTSAAYTNDGSAPIFSLNMNTGEMIVRHPSNGGYIHVRNNGVFLVQGGIVTVEMSLD